MKLLVHGHGPATKMTMQQFEKNDKKQENSDVYGNWTPTIIFPVILVRGRFSREGDGGRAKEHAALITRRYMLCKGFSTGRGPVLRATGSA